MTREKTILIAGPCTHRFPRVVAFCPICGVKQEHEQAFAAIPIPVTDKAEDQHPQSGSNIERREASISVVTNVAALAEETSIRSPETAQNVRHELQTNLASTTAVAPRASTSSNPDVLLLVEKAAYLMKMGNYPSAISQLTKALGLEPWDPRLQTLLAETKKRWGQMLIKQHR